MATISADFWAIYLTLTEDETKGLETAEDITSGVSAIVSGLASAIPGGIAAAAISAMLAGYLQIEEALVAAVDQGNGVTLNLPWVAIWADQFWLIYPTAVSVQMQQNWRWCSRCAGLFWPGTDPTAGVCPAGGAHGPNTSSNYRLVMNVPNYQGQHDWRWCGKCSGAFWAGGQQNAGVCPAGGTHPRGGSADYGLVTNDPSFSGQHGWRWCEKCSGLFWVFNASSTTGGTCPAGGGHVQGGTTDYALMD
jgi:hypothetical protein